MREAHFLQLTQKPSCGEAARTPPRKSEDPQNQTHLEEYVMKRIVSNMAGVVLEYLVQTGDTMACDKEGVMLKSMKMNILIELTVSGKVKEDRANLVYFVQVGYARTVVH